MIYYTFQYIQMFLGNFFIYTYQFISISVNPSSIL